MKTVSFKMLGDWLITAYGTKDPSEEDWEACAQTFRGLDIDRLKILIYTKGGAPNSAQRMMMNNVLDGRQPAAAVVSSSAVARGIATAMSWFNKSMKVYPPKDLASALRYLEVPTAKHELFMSEVNKLLLELD